MDIYDQKIIQLAADIPHIGRLDRPDAQARAVSRLCGSEVEVQLCVQNDRITQFAQQVKACILGQAASSIMGRHIIGSHLDELVALAETMRAMLYEKGAPPKGKWADLEILLPVRDYKTRHASTLLTFNAVESCIRQVKGK